MHHAILWLRAFVADYGYWAVALALLAESMGIPVPGEITLLAASFLAYHEHRLHLGWIIVIATAAATLGGDLGYAVGLYGGRPLLDRYQSWFRIPAATLARAEETVMRYGAAAIFFARFFFGLRVFAGPLAGALRMRWRAFAICNFLGAAVWVTAIASVGYLFGQHWHRLVQMVQRFNLVVVFIGAAVIFYLWWRRRSAPSAS